MKVKSRNPPSEFVLCIKSDDPDLLTPRMIYRRLDDQAAAKSRYFRVIDNEGEDYLYPARFFVPIDVPPSVRRSLLRPSARAERSAAAARTQKRAMRGEIS